MKMIILECLIVKFKFGVRTVVWDLPKKPFFDPQKATFDTQKATFRPQKANLKNGVFDPSYDSTVVGFGRERPVHRRVFAPEGVAFVIFVNASTLRGQKNLVRLIVPTCAK